MSSECPRTGGGVHAWLLSRANRLRREGMTKEEVAERLRIESAKCGRTVPPREISATVDTAFSSSAPRRTTVDAPYDESALCAAVARVPEDSLWIRDLLRERSAVDPLRLSTGEFLAHLYDEEEACAVWREKNDSRPQIWRDGDEVRAGSVFYLTNPVDGLGHPRLDGKPGVSYRNASAVTSWRYCLLESDAAPPNLWIRWVLTLPIHIQSIVSSGRRSLHALWRLDASSEEDFRARVDAVRGVLTRFGCDPGALSAVRPSRLPGAIRPETGQWQRVWFVRDFREEATLDDRPIWES